ncbi:MAG: CRTAC1 family protein, partial [bacterium]
NGDGTFANITESAGVTNYEWGCSAAFFDYDLDGFLDIYVTNYVNYDSSFHCPDKSGRPEYCGPKAFTGVPDVLLKNNGNCTFSDVSLLSRIAEIAANGLGVVSADFNGDSYPDLYVANDAEPNLLWINQRDGTFNDRALEYGLALNELGREEASMGVAIGDIENDADFDIFLTHLRGESNTFYRFSEEYGYEDLSAVVGFGKPDLIGYTGFGTGFLDFDNDGDLDLAVGNGRILRGAALMENDSVNHWDYYAEPNQLFENHNAFFVQTRNPDDAFTANVETTRGLTFGDIDNDGDIDILASNISRLARLYRNEMQNKGNWLIIRAIDPALKRDAIGAKIIVRTENKQYIRSISPSYSYLSSNDSRVHFGLGSAKNVDEIIVEWPGGKIESFPGVQANQIIVLKKGGL